VEHGFFGAFTPLPPALPKEYPFSLPPPGFKFYGSPSSRRVFRLDALRIRRFFFYLFYS